MTKLKYIKTFESHSKLKMTKDEYIITDEIPKEGDYAINPEDPKRKPRLVVRYSDENPTLGMHLEPSSWFKWLPLRDSHRKVIFK